jgi:hypothetical protein
LLRIAIVTELFKIRVAEKMGLKEKMFSPCRALGLLACAIPLSTFAVNPLITDDADPVGFGRLQINSGLQFSRAAGEKLFDYSANPVFGIAPRGEIGATFGYQWRNGISDKADGVTDLTLETKWRLLGKADDDFKLSARADLKLPTATDRNFLGTGEPDADLVLIATRTWGKTSLDWNLAYEAIDISRGDWRDDRWFLGQAVRQQLDDRWTLIGETYGTFSQGHGDANFNFDGGVQFNLSANLTLSALIGSAVGRNTPDLTSYLGLSWTF